MGRNSDSEETLDPDVVAGLWSLGGPGLVRDLVSLFAEDSQARLAALHRAYQSGDASGVAMAAHALRGSSANLGATHLAEIAGVLEHLAGGGVLGGAEALVAELDSCWEQAVSALHSEADRALLQAEAERAIGAARHA